MTEEGNQRSGRTYRLREVRIIDRPIDEVFEYASDFVNSAEWDPGVNTAEQTEPGPVRVGTRYRLVGNFGQSNIPMDYQVLEYETPHRVVLSGEGSAFDALDTMTFESAGQEATKITYQADITLYNFLRFLGPLMNWPMTRMGKRALDGLVASLEK